MNSQRQLLSVSKILWHDPNVNSPENRNYIAQVSQLGCSLEQINSVEMTTSLLKASPQRNYLIITSGSNGQKLLENIHSFDNIIGVIVFCFQIDKHKKWADKYKKVTKVVNKIQDVLAEVKKLFGKYLILSALECTNETDYDNAISLLTGSNVVDNPEISEYYHIRNQPVLDFTLTNLLIKEVPKNQDVLDELLPFNKEEKAQKEIKKIFKKIEEKDFNLLKAFCFLYSTDLIYHPFNLACATRSYSKIIKTLRFLLQDLKKQETKIFKETVVLYRGMPKDSVNLQQYQDASGFWPCFSSTSRKEKVAKQFALRKGAGGFVFVITLSQKNMHPGIIIGSEWSQFPLEDEILLFPYLSLTTTLIEKKKDLTYIHVKQNDKDTVLSLEETSIWIERVRKNLKESIELEFDKISRDLDNALDITQAGEEFEASLIKKLNISVQDYIHEKKAEFFSNNNEEEIPVTPKQGLLDDLQTRILPQIINEALDEVVLGLYEQTNKRIHKIVSELNKKSSDSL